MKNKLFVLTLISIVILSFSLSVFGQQKPKIDTFNFQFEGKKYSGLIDYPDNKPPKGIVIFVPGDGPTNINDKSWFAYTLFDSLRTSFKKAGLACVLWDKAGCGKSEGDTIITKQYKIVHKKYWQQ